MTPSGHAPHRAHAALARDAALARVGHARRFAIVGAAGLSAGFAALVSASPPSKASTTAKRTTAPAAPRRSTSVMRPGQAPALPPLADGSALGLQGPTQGPGPSDNGSGQAPAQAAPSQQQDQSAAAAPAPSPQPGPVSGGS